MSPGQPTQPASPKQARSLGIARFPPHPSPSSYRRSHEAPLQVIDLTQSIQSKLAPRPLPTSLEVHVSAVQHLGSSKVTAWFDQEFEAPTPAQEAAWPIIQRGTNVLILSPTGTGKTLAAFLAVLNQLALDHAAGQLEDSIQVLYISPLRALAYDLAKNLNRPLEAIFGPNPPIRVGLRNGDTEPTERDRQVRSPPHVLLTTPESLCLLLSQSKWLPHLETVRWVIIDELHALAENKRGAHLSLSLERLEALRASHSNSPPSPLHRIGLSATIAPVAEAGGFLCGTHRPFEVVDVSTAKRIDLRVHSPLQRNPYPPAGFSGVRMISELARLVRQNRTTLVFTNTRSGAESASYWLREQIPDLAPFIECHHASLDRDVRLEVEDRLKRGELRAVVCSTSLELGIDIGSIDLVVMIATPKGVSRALQRTGRAGHSIHQVSHGCLMATNIHDLVECCATARLARAGHLDSLRIPIAPLDVLAQQLMGMGCIQEWSRSEAFQLVSRAWPYRNLSQTEFDDVLDYLAGGGQSLRRQYEEVFGRIHLDDSKFEARAGAPKRDFLENIGTIATEGVARVWLGPKQLGTIEEGFLAHLRIGDIFSMGGRALRLERLGTLECWVQRADGQSPTVPRWNANKFPLANRVAQEIRRFRAELRSRMESSNSTPDLCAWIASRLDCGQNNAAVIHRIHAMQQGISEIPTGDFLLVEELLVTNPALLNPFAPVVTAPSSTKRSAPQHPPNTSITAHSAQLVMPPVVLPSRASKRPTPTPPPPQPPASTPSHPDAGRHYFFHALIGRAANDALSRVVALRLSHRIGGNAVATADDYGFVLSLDAQQSLDPAGFKDLFSPEKFLEDLDESLGRSHLLKHHFRNAAQTGLMVYRNYFGQAKAARKVQWSTEVIFNVLAQHEPNHVLLREARRDAHHSFLDATRALAYLKDLDTHQRPIRLRTVSMVPPLSFGMFATRIKEALLLEDPQETLEQLFHHWWNRLEGNGTTPPSP